MILRDEINGILSTFHMQWRKLGKRVESMYQSVVERHRVLLKQELEAEVVNGWIVEGIDVGSQIYCHQQELSLNAKLDSLLPEESLGKEKIRKILQQKYKSKVQALLYEEFRSERSRIKKIVEKKPEVYNLCDDDVAEDLKLLAEEGSKFTGRMQGGEEEVLRKFHHGVRDGILTIVRKKAGVDIGSYENETAAEMIKRASSCFPELKKELQNVLRRYEWVKKNIQKYRPVDVAGREKREIKLKERDGIFVESADKGVGIVQYSLDWSLRNYEEQTRKGSYAAVEQGEQEVMEELVRGLQEVDKKMTETERTIFRSYCDSRPTEEIALGQVCTFL